MYINRNKEEEVDPQNHPVVKFASKYFKVTPRLDGGHFFHVENGVKYMTPLFLVLLVIEFTDLIFAVDSIPAIFSVTKDPYIVFFSNIFAVLGLRSMFFLLVNIIHKFHYLKVGLAFLLIFIGAKMLLHSWLEKIGFETIHSLIIIVSILVLSIVASLMFPKKQDLLHWYQEDLYTAKSSYARGLCCLCKRRTSCRFWIPICVMIFTRKTS